MDVLTFTICPEGQDETRADLEDFLEALTRANERYFRRLPQGPCCPHCAGVRYAPPTLRDALAPGEHFESAERLVVLGVGACGSIAAMVAGRMRALEGRSARVRLVDQDSDRRWYHAVVELEDGTIIDPSAELERAANSAPEEPSCGCELSP